MTDDEQSPDPVAPGSEPTEPTEPMNDTQNGAQDGTEWDSYPPLMTPQQIASACSITDAQARMNGRRGYYGKKTVRLKGRKELTYYERENVRAYYASQRDGQAQAVAPSETGVPMGLGPATLLRTLDTLAKKTETEALNAATIDRLSRQNEKLVERVGELERLLREQAEQWIPVAFGLFRKRH